MGEEEWVGSGGWAGAGGKGRGQAGSDAGSGGREVSGPWRGVEGRASKAGLGGGGTACDPISKGRLPPPTKDRSPLVPPLRLHFLNNQECTLPCSLRWTLLLQS